MDRLDAEDLLSSFITMLTRGRHWTQCWPRRIQSLVPFILKCLFLQNQGFFQAFPLKYCTWTIFILCLLYPSSFSSSTIWSPHNIVSNTNHEASHNAVFYSVLQLDRPYVKLCSTLLVCPLPRRRPEPHSFAVSSSDERSTCYMLGAIVLHLRFSSSCPAWP